jgi:hypothetical protein
MSFEKGIRIGFGRLKHSLSLRADALDHQADIAKVQERAGHVDELRAHIKALQGSAPPLANQNQPQAPPRPRGPGRRAESRPQQDNGAGLFNSI